MCAYKYAWICKLELSVSLGSKELYRTYNEVIHKSMNSKTKTERFRAHILTQYA